MTALATVDDLAARWRPLDAATTTVAQALLGDASALLRARVPGLDARLADATLDRALVVPVVCAMVRRVLANPDGVVAETVGGYSYRRSDALDGRLEPTADELALLAASDTAAVAFTVRPAWAP